MYSTFSSSLPLAPWLEWFDDTFVSIFSSLMRFLLASFKLVRWIRFIASAASRSDAEPETAVGVGTVGAVLRCAGSGFRRIRTFGAIGTIG